MNDQSELRKRSLQTRISEVEKAKMLMWFTSHLMRSEIALSGSGSYTLQEGMGHDMLTETMEVHHQGTSYERTEARVTILYSRPSRIVAVGKIYNSRRKDAESSKTPILVPEYRGEQVSSRPQTPYELFPIPNNVPPQC
jgi:hypothetical protein